MRLKANKTSLYNLVATYKPLPGMRRVDFQKANGRPDYWLEWTTDDGRRPHESVSFLLPGAPDPDDHDARRGGRAAVP